MTVAAGFIGAYFVRGLVAPGGARIYRIRNVIPIYHDCDKYYRDWRQCAVDGSGAAAAIGAASILR